MDVPDFRSLIEASLSAQQRFRSAWEPATPDESLTVPDEKALAVLSELELRLKENYPFFHPRYAGQMIKPPHPMAMAAYLMAMQINPNNHALDGGPATAALEMETVAQLAAMFGLPTHLGHLTSSGTAANMEALWVAGSIHPGKRIVFSRDAHYTHQRMCDVLKIQSGTVDWNDEESIEREFRSGSIGTAVVTMGTTGTGSVEPLHRILQLARQYGVRIHADAAYGGFFMLLADRTDGIIDGRPFAALKECDSIVIDPHKHGLQPYGCGCVLFRDPSVGRFYQHDSPYTYFTSKELHLGEISLECSRAGASAAALWATLKVLPLQKDAGLGAVLAKTRNAARLWHRSLNASSLLFGWKEPDLDIVVYAPKTRSFSASSVSAASTKIFSRGMEQKTSPFYLATYVVDSALLAEQIPSFLPDIPATTLLRSVLMKPEHEQFVPRLFTEVEKTAAEVISMEQSEQ